jgi:coenzyme F420 hydrogenase subunit beta
MRDGGLNEQNFALLKAEVIDAGLCTRCGSCVGVCPEGAIQFDDPLGEVLPMLIGECCDRGGCYASCPGKFVSWPELNAQVFGFPSGQAAAPNNFLVGQHLAAYVGYSTDEQLRGNGASGGVISAISAYLLEQGMVDGVITLIDSPQEPYRAIPQIITRREEVLAAAQSRYSISPVNTILGSLAALPGRYAYVGLPCQVHSLRKLQAARYPGIEKIHYIIGTYCGNILHFDAVRSFLRRSGVSDLAQVRSLKYRAGTWPGRMEIRLHDGRIFSLEKFYANYLIPFYIMQRCLLCTDLTNEFADISAGDGWTPVYEERGKGSNIVLVRTPVGAALINEMREQARLELHEISDEAVVNMHSHGLDLKKRGAFLRIAARTQVGKAVPQYGYELVTATRARRLQETVIDLVFSICGRPLPRRLVNLIPVQGIGRLFKLLRKVWIRTTRSTKRSGLFQTQFRLTEDQPPHAQADQCNG